MSIKKINNNIKRIFTNEAGFTLIEMVIVVSVIALLMSIAVPTLSSVVDKTNEAVAKSDLHNIMHSLELYYMENYNYPDSIDGGDLSDIESVLTELKISNTASDYDYITETTTKPGKYIVAYQNSDNEWLYISSDEGGVVGPESTEPAFDTGT
jgi:general secretion pathway protein G